MRLAGCALPEAGGHALDSRFRSYFAEVMASYSVCNRKEPAPCSYVLWRRRNYMPEKVLVPRTNSSDVGNLCELNVHGYFGRMVALGNTANSCRDRRLMASIH